VPATTRRAPPRQARPRRWNVVDSSAWLAYFADEPGADRFAAAIEDDALQAAAVMQQGRIVPLDAELALAVAATSLEHRLPFADSVVYATARAVDSVLWTQDDHFAALDDVQYFPKRA
jgi:uncharacterized protein with PIN domain